MRPFRSLAALAFAALMLPLPARVGAAGWQSWDAGLKAAGESGRPVLVDVYTDWCGWCRRMERDVYGQRDVQDYLGRKFVTVKLNAESNEMVRYQGRALTARAVAARFGVTGYPTTIFLSPSGAYLGNVPGYTPPADFLQLLRYIGDGHMDRGESFEDFKRGATTAPGAAARPRR